jgi:hypothetical protein
MNIVRISKTAAAAGGVLALLLGADLLSPRVGRADDGNDNGNSDEAKVKIGFAISPVPLNVKGKNHDLVGLGSYIVNAQSSCNDCHTLSAQAEYSFPGIPYFGQKPTIVNPAVYLGGGNDFGPVAGPGTPDIVSRNLTPDKSGLPEGGHTFTQFVDIMRNGTDYDHLHPTCSSTVTSNCLPPPFDGNLLQIMPWPILHNMTDRDLAAIYEFLKAVPCVAGPPTGVLHNDCP